MTAAATSPRGGGGPAGALRAGAVAWRRLTWREIKWAALAGAAVGVIQAMGAAIWVTPTPGPAALAGIVLPLVVQALLLLWCLTVAARGAPARAPRWLAFVAAGCLATLASTLLDALAIAPLAGDVPPAFAREWFAMVWFNAPSYFLIGILASLGYMHAIDGEQRQRMLRKLQFDRTSLARQAYQARLQSLQARVEPRLLFDTLTDVETLYETQPDQARRMLDDLIAYLRAALPTAHDAASTLSVEFTLARTWLDIMQVRTNGRLRYEVAPVLPSADARLPAMLVLPLVQQAYDSATGPERDRPDIAVGAQRRGDRLRITVASARSSFTARADPRALAAIRERLHALYGEDAGIELRAVDDGASEAIVDLPWEPCPEGPPAETARRAPSP